MIQHLKRSNNYHILKINANLEGFDCHNNNLKIMDDINRAY